MPAILFVEDDKHQRMLLKEEFTHEGYTALTAPNSDAALATVERAMPDLATAGTAKSERTVRMSEAMVWSVSARRRIMESKLFLLSYA